MVVFSDSIVMQNAAFKCFDLFDFIKCRVNILGDVSER